MAYQTSCSQMTNSTAQDRINETCVHTYNFGQASGELDNSISRQGKASCRKETSEIMSNNAMICPTHQMSRKGNETRYSLPAGLMRRHYRLDCDLRASVVCLGSKESARHMSAIHALSAPRATLNDACLRQVTLHSGFMALHCMLALLWGSH